MHVRLSKWPDGMNSLFMILVLLLVVVVVVVVATWYICAFCIDFANLMQARHS